MTEFEKKTIIVSSLVVIILVSILTPVLYNTSYIIRGENAIIFLIGDPPMEFDDWRYTSEQIADLKEQYGEYWNNLINELGELWGWDFYFFYKTKCDFSRYRYEKLFLLLSGHSRYSEHPTLRINAEETILVEKIKDKIHSLNFTVLAEACYSLSWKNLFEHDGMNEVYTSDLENKLSSIRYFIQGGSPWLENDTVSLYRIESFSYFFIEQLLLEKNFTQANATAISKAYQLDLTGVDPTIV
ncbi:MAG: hypothetical protein KGD64_09190 [Candidatus Heimdallarchaeota archaeon]|nr:hypothetical protein [Candidatus Heimdallarchaeota archaeon]